MKRILSAVALSALFVPASASADDATATCKKALGNLTRLAAEAGEGAMSDEDQKKFVEQCAGMPEEIRTCMAAVVDEKSMEACMASAMRLAFEEAAKEEAAKEGATKEVAKAPTSGTPECNTALATMRRINKDLGEPDPSASQQADFLKMCAEWSPEVRGCLVKASDKEAVEGCLKTMMEQAIEKAGTGE
ncbi:MAG: hypothetical protein AMXMBFR64_58440 [Myxococcales bacterium]